MCTAGHRTIHTASKGGQKRERRDHKNQLPWVWTSGSRGRFARYHLFILASLYKIKRILGLETAQLFRALFAIAEDQSSDSSIPVGHLTTCNSSSRKSNAILCPLHAFARTRARAHAHALTHTHRVPFKKESIMSSLGTNRPASKLEG